MFKSAKENLTNILLIMALLGAVGGYAWQWAERSYHPMADGLRLAANQKHTLESFKEVQKNLKDLNKWKEDQEKEKLREQIRRLMQEREQLKNQSGGRR